MWRSETSPRTTVRREDQSGLPIVLLSSTIHQQLLSLLGRHAHLVFRLIGRSSVLFDIDDLHVRLEVMAYLLIRILDDASRLVPTDEYFDHAILGEDSTQ